MVLLFGVVMVALVGGANPSAVQAQRPSPMFPDGLEHDFGRVPRGTQCQHTFRIVNTGAVPLRLVSLRFS